MFDFDSLKSAKKEAAVNDEKFSDKYDTVFKDGRMYLKNFQKSQDVNTLQKAAEKFGEAIECKSTSAEANFYMAICFYLIGEDELAMKYLKVVQTVEPGYKGLNVLMSRVIEKR
jgi:tetratricopeptide (TPR) repeat protein